MDRNNAIAEIRKIVSLYQHRVSATKNYALLRALENGKLYELYVLAKTVEALASRGHRISFVGTSLQFKAAPGKLDVADPHFLINEGKYRLFTDIEFTTFGSDSLTNTDLSHRHEIDIVAVDIVAGYPKYSNIAIGVECKAHARFKKATVKEVLGIRRELGKLGLPTKSLLAGASGCLVPANPASEYWLAYLDPAGDQYKLSPQRFGIQFLNWKP